MKSSTRMKRVSQRVVLMAESLEGRQLLSTLTSAHAVNLGVHRAHVSQQRGGSRPAAMMSAFAQAADTASGSIASITAPTTVGHWTRPLGRGRHAGPMAIDNLVSAPPTTTATAAATTTATATATPPVASTASAPATANPGGPMVGGPWGGGPRDRMIGQPGAGTSTGSTATAPTATQVAAFTQLSTDMQAIHDKSTVTPVLEAAARKDFEAIHKAATSAPDATKLAALQSDLKTTAGTIPTDAQKAQTQADFKAVVASEGVTDTALIDKTLADVDAIAVASNVTADDLAKLAADRTAAGLPAEPGGPGLDLGLGLLGGQPGMGVGFGGDHFGRPSGQFRMMAPPVTPPTATTAATTTTTTPAVTPTTA